jgi:hypothetical protein
MSEGLLRIFFGFLDYCFSLGKGLYSLVYSRFEKYFYKCL